jgi:hypothetical protein
MNDKDRVREEIAKFLYEHQHPRMFHTFEELELKYRGSAEGIRRFVDRLLTKLETHGMVLLHPDQTLPVVTLREAEEHDSQWAQSNFTDSMQEFAKKKMADMIRAGWRRIIE